MKLSAAFASAAFAAALVTGSAASAATVVASESFETPALNGAPSIQYGPDRFSYNTNAVGPVVIPGVTFTGFSGIIQNGSFGVFPDTSFGTQAGFLQSYSDANAPGANGAQIDWNLTGLTIGQHYQLSFVTTSGPLVGVEPYTVSGLGITPVNFTPGGAYVTQTIDFIANATSGAISFAGPASTTNRASAIDNLVLSAVPEPASWAMMIIGFFGLGAMMRASRRRLVHAAH